MGSYTEIVNRTSKALKLQVGNNRVYREIAIVEKDGVYKISVDPNTTYHEFCMGVDAAGKSVIVDSDECVDNKCITITESVDGKFDVVKVPRQHVQQPQVDQVAPTTFRSAGTTVFSDDRTTIRELDILESAKEIIRAKFEIASSLPDA
ncbi:hypothetical protein BDL97_04G028000 [Sphagnum fallax]|jgi:aspartate ammonia-lyase|nr:hypothetical protein BDL97_04G028000 [Sphagnum fallax]